MTEPQVSPERREEIRALWNSYTPNLNDFWSFIAALDAQAKSEADARVEAMRERCAKAAAQSAFFDRNTIITTIHSFPIEGDGR